MENELSNPIIFIDLDSVLVTQAGTEYNIRTTNETHDSFGQMFCPKAVESLDKIIQTYKADLVLISKWGANFNSVTATQSMLNARRLKWNIKAIIPITKKKLQRGEEIQQWMLEFGTPERFVIIDGDVDNDITGFFPGKTVETNDIDGIADRRAYRRCNSIIKRREEVTIKEEVKVNSIF